MATRKQPKRKVGRPPKPTAERRRNQIKFRATDDLYESLARSASKYGRSISEEAEFRLDQSFRDEVMVGGSHVRPLVILTFAAVKLVEQTMGERWDTDLDTGMRTTALINALLIQFLRESFGADEAEIRNTVEEIAERASAAFEAGWARKGNADSNPKGGKS